ncbi:Gfo/Idh/MocA family protein [Arthrobacter bambusae]|uniref:Gfo/Idh/MocA family protein n=1 Tax=Arthrobacter bambusae TaxID=1338426 RepID=UPI00355724C7
MGRPKSVSAALGYVTRRDVEDNAVVTFHYPDGAIGVAETSYVSAYTPFLDRGPRHVGKPSLQRGRNRGTYRARAPGRFPSVVVRRRP